MPRRFPKRVVYYDARCGAVWLGKVAEKIANYFSDAARGADRFEMKDASEIAAWMEDAIETHEAPRSVVLFAQDIAPTTVADTSHPNALIRKYLEAGGRAVWIGDVPFYYRGSLKNKWGVAGAYGILGVICIGMDSPQTRTKRKRFGRSFFCDSKFPEKHTWYGVRPALQTGWRRNNMTCLSYSQPIYPLVMRVRTIGEENIRVVGRIAKGLISLLAVLGPAAILGIVYSFGLSMNLLLDWLKQNAATLAVLLCFIVAFALWLYRRVTSVTYANTWFKNYNPKYPHSGFLRTWDYMVEGDIPEDALSELFRLALHGFPPKQQ